MKKKQNGEKEASCQALNENFIGLVLLFFLSNLIYLVLEFIFRFFFYKGKSGNILN